MPQGMGYARLSAKLSGGSVRPQTKTSASPGRKYYPIKKKYYSPAGTLPNQYNKLS